MIFFLFLFSIKASFGAGMTVHLFMADEAIKRVKHSDLKKLLNKHKSVVRNGSTFPDTGYVIKNGFGEYTHWADFQNLYLKYIQQNCSWPFKNIRCEKLYAHLMGVAAHALGDSNWDGEFVPQSAKNDFNGEYDKADSFTSIALDMATIIKYKKSSVPFPFLPKKELSWIYKTAGPKAGKKTKHGHMSTGYHITRMLKVFEVMGSPFAYLHVRRKAPWSFENFVEAKGGVYDSAQKIANYWNEIWRIIKKHRMKKLPLLKNHGHWPNTHFNVEERD